MAPDIRLRSEKVLSQEVIAIEHLLSEQEEAIRDRFPELWQLYTQLRNKYVKSTGGLDVKQTEEQVLAKRLLMSSSFIAATFTSEGNIKKRDKVAQSCAIALSSMGGLSPQNWMEELIKAESAWAQVIPEQRPLSIAIAKFLIQWLIVLVLAGILIYWLAF